MLPNPLSFLVVILSLAEVHPQVCVTQKILTSSYIKTYIQIYRDKHGFGPVLTKTIVKTLTKSEVKEFKFCCKGYSKEYQNNEASQENCKPICKSNCTNGYCERPEECACNAGYRKLNDTCVPSCERDCVHGACIAPNTCRCDSGYNLVNDTCQPICTKPCHNGTCTSPETCECLPGFKSGYDNRDSVCKPHCPGGCPNHGFCDSTGECKCRPGWRFIGNNSNTCWPECRKPCGNGTCVFRDFCLCFRGFQINYLRHEGLEDGPVCEPICKECVGNNCVIPINSKKCIGEHGTTIGDETTITTTVPFKIARSTYHYYNVTENTTTSTTTTSVPYFVSSSTTDIIVGNYTHTNVTSRDPIAKSWMQQNEAFILIPIAVLVIIGVILLLVWRGTIMNHFRRKSYNVQGAFLKRNVHGSFENLQFRSNELETQS